MSVQPGERGVASTAQPGVAVINPGGSDPDQRFPLYAGRPEPKEHPPVNYHAYAACTAGSFHRKIETILPGQRRVILLLRRDLKLGLATLVALQAGGKTVAVSLKESGSHQAAALLADPRRLALFREICGRADFCLSSTPDLLPFYLGAGARRAEFVPTPYPVETPSWDFSRPLEERRGIFIGTREFEVPSRNHLAALLAARTLAPEETVTVLNGDGRSGRRTLEALGFPDGTLRIVEGRLDYPDYLRLMAGHRLVFQLDRSAVPGQVAGDALLCGVPCVGGDGATERLAFPGLNGFGRDTPQLLGECSRLLLDRGAYESAVADSRRLARERLSFEAVAGRLGLVFG